MRQEQDDRWRIAVGLGAWVVALAPGCREATTSAQAPSYAEARAVIEAHCVSCHSEQPSLPAFPIAPMGVLLDTPTQMQQYAERIKARTVLDRTMPLLNKTGMTEDERGLLASWVEHGARGP
jgi:uncharacterized membrane protein